MSAKLKEPKYRKSDDKADELKEKYDERKEDLKAKLDKKIVELLKGWPVPDNREQITELMDFLAPHFGWLALKALPKAYKSLYNECKKRL